MRRNRSLVNGQRRCLMTLLAPIILLGSVVCAQAQISAEGLLSAVVGISVTVPGEARTATTLGTEREGAGIVIDDKGLVLTIGYLTLEAEAITVTTAKGKTLAANPVAYSPETGLGLIRIQGESGTKPLPLGDSDPLEEGQAVLVAGFGRGAIRPAFVSDLREFAGPWEYLLDKAIFTTPPHPAFGGAGLIGEQGQLLGVGYLFVANAGIGETPVPGNMFVPINKLRPILAGMLENGRGAGTARPWIGMYSAESRGRLFVERVAAGGPAESAGVESGDVVLEVGGKPVKSLAEMYRRIWALGPAGVAVPVTLLKGSSVRRVSIESIDRSKWFKPPRTF